jgi:hypothetical protein
MDTQKQEFMSAIYLWRSNHVDSFFSSHKILLSCILLLAAILRFFQIGAESLWIDEALSVQDTLTGKGLPPNNFIRPLYYILLRFWLLLGDSDAWLRSLSAIFGIISVLLIFRLGCQIANKPTGLLAAFFLACSPLAINHSQEIRMYMLSLCLGVAGSSILVDFIKTPNARSGISWISLRFLAILSTPINLLLLLADGAILVVQFRIHRTFLRFKFLVLTVCFLLVPTTIALNHALPEFFQKKQGATLPPDLRAIVGMLARLVVWPLDFNDTSLTWLYNPLFDIFALTISSLIIFAIFVALKRMQKLMLWNATLAFLPLAALFIISHATGFGAFRIPRYIVFTSPYVILLIAYALTSLWEYRKVITSLITIILFTFYLSIVSINLNYYYSTALREDWRGVSQLIKISEQPGDMLIVSPPIFRTALDYYYTGNLQIYPLSLESEESTFSSSLCNIDEYGGNLWMVFRFHGGLLDAQEARVKTMIEEEFNILRRQVFSGGIEAFYVEAPCTSESME